MKKFLPLTLAIALTLALVSCSSGGNKDSGTSGDVIRIGVIGNMAGADAYIAYGGLYAMQDYADELNATGGLLGRKIEIIPYDIGSNNDEVVNAVNKLCYDDKVNVIIGPNSSQHTIAATPIVTAAKVPLIAISATNPSCTVDNNGNIQPYIFRVCMIDPYQGTALADFAYNKLDNPTVGIIAPIDNSYAQGLSDYFTTRYEELGGTVVDNLGYKDNEVEFRAQLTDLANRGANCVFVAAAAYKDAAFMAQQSKELGLDFKWLFGDGVYAQELIDNAGAILNNCSYLATGITDAGGTYDEYYAQFNSRHNDQTANIYSLYAMDAIMAYEYAVKTAGSVDGDAVCEALANMSEVSLFTGTMTMEPDTHNPHNKPVSIVTIKDGQFELFEVYTVQD